MIKGSKNYCMTLNKLISLLHLSFRDALDSLKSGKDRGLSKIRKDIITRPTEGIVDMTEPAFDVANIYVSFIK